MSIPVVCPNGHEIKVKDKYAGKVCFCPVCRARVTVVAPEQDAFPEDSNRDIPESEESELLDTSSERPVFSEDSIMDVLQPQESGLSGLSLEIADFNNEECQWIVHRPSEDVERVCAKCQHAIPDGAQTCPHCHAYVASFEA